MCKVSGLVQGISVAASVFTLVAIAVDRFRCVVYPFKPKITIKTAFVTIVIIWVLAITIISPSAVMLQEQEEKYYRVRLPSSQNKTSTVYWCREAWPNQEMRKVYTTVLFATIYLAPLSFIVVMYGRIGASLFKTVARYTGKQSQEQWHVSKKKQKVIKMLLTVALLFILSWLPLWTLMMLSDYADLSPGQLRIINIYIYPLAHWLAFCNSSVNPIIYGFFNENFRNGFQDAFQIQICQKKAKPQETYVLRAQSNMIINTPGPLTQESAPQRPCGENLLCRKSAENLKQELMIEELQEATNSTEV